MISSHQKSSASSIDSPKQQQKRTTHTHTHNLTKATKKRIMLHRTLLKSGHAEVAHHSGNAVHAAAAKKIIPNSASYYNRTDLGWVHGHKEMNYRKHSYGFKAYTKECMDPFGPFGNTTPLRHMETFWPSAWFAGGTIPWHQWGFLRWPAMRQSLKWWGTPFPVMYVAYRMRYAKGGYTQKNVGAVFGSK